MRSSGALAGKTRDLCFLLLVSSHLLLIDGLIMGESILQTIVVSVIDFVNIVRVQSSS